MQSNFTTLESFQDEVVRLLSERFGMELNDVCMDAIARAFESGDSPELHVDEIAEKYDLTDMSDLLGY